MSVTATPIFPQALRNSVQTILPADASAVKAVLAAGSNGSKVEALNVTSTDTSARDVTIYVTISATNYLIGTVSIPLNSGNTNSAPSVDILRSSQLPALAFDANGNRFLYLASGSTLSIACTSTVTTAKQITVFAQGEDF
jgi:hypothetical protein